MYRYVVSLSVCLSVRIYVNVCVQLTADREVQRILLELLNQMDGFDQTVNVKVPPYTDIDTYHYIDRYIPLHR